MLDTGETFIPALSSFKETTVVMTLLGSSLKVGMNLETEAAYFSTYFEASKKTRSD